MIGWKQSETTGETRCEKVIVGQFTQANKGLLVWDDPGVDLTNTNDDLEMKRDAEQMILYRMAKVHNCLEL